MRVVADTNVVISMLLWGKSLERLFVLVNTRRITLCFSPQTIEELVRVVQYPRIQKQAEKCNVPVHSLLDKLFASSHIVYPALRVTVITEDESDNRLLETAIAARADYIISGDAHLLRIGAVDGIPVLAPKRLLAMF